MYRRTRGARVVSIDPAICYVSGCASFYGTRVCHATEIPVTRVYMREERPREVVVSLLSPRFLNSLFLKLGTSGDVSVSGREGKRRMMERTRRIFVTEALSRYLLPPSMRRIRYRFASNIPSFPLSLPLSCLDNHGEGGREEEERDLG